MATQKQPAISQSHLNPEDTKTESAVLGTYTRLRSMLAMNRGSNHTNPRNANRRASFGSARDEMNICNFTYLQGIRSLNNIAHCAEEVGNSTSSTCPYKGESGASTSWLRKLCPYKPGDSGASKGTEADNASKSTNSGTRQINAAKHLASDCPMSGQNRADAGIKQVQPKSLKVDTKFLASKCPIMHEKPEDQSSHGYGGVAGDEINPRNMMPQISENPLSSDKVTFSKAREVSTIPKTGEESSGQTNWVYPSPQQFYNALRRRDKVDEEDELEKDNTMNAIVFAHNVTNERTWNEIMEWEQMHFAKCPTPTLLRFVGRSEDWSPKAYVSAYFSAKGAPFDRHDWIIDRCGLEQVRYVIDYYDDVHAGDTEELDISLDTRPALDSFGNFFDRLRFPFWRMMSAKKDESEK